MHTHVNLIDSLSTSNTPLIIKSPKLKRLTVWAERRGERKNDKSLILERQRNRTHTHTHTESTFVICSLLKADRLPGRRLFVTMETQTLGSWTPSQVVSLSPQHSWTIKSFCAKLPPVTPLFRLHCYVTCVRSDPSPTPLPTSSPPQGRRTKSNQRRGILHDGASVGHGLSAHQQVNLVRLFFSF